MSSQIYRQRRRVKCYLALALMSVGCIRQNSLSQARIQEFESGGFKPLKPAGSFQVPDGDYDGISFMSYEGNQVWLRKKVGHDLVRLNSGSIGVVDSNLKYLKEYSSVVFSSDRQWLYGAASPTHGILTSATHNVAGKGTPWLNPLRRNLASDFFLGRAARIVQGNLQGTSTRELDAFGMELLLSSPAPSKDGRLVAVGFARKVDSVMHSFIRVYNVQTQACIDVPAGPAHEAGYGEMSNMSQITWLSKTKFSYKMSSLVARNTMLHVHELNALPGGVSWLGHVKSQLSGRSHCEVATAAKPVKSIAIKPTEWVSADGLRQRTIGFDKVSGMVTVKEVSLAGGPVRSFSAPLAGAPAEIHWSQSGNVYVRPSDSVDIPGKVLDFNLRTIAECEKNHDGVRTRNVWNAEGNALVIDNTICGNGRIGRLEGVVADVAWDQFSDTLAVLTTKGDGPMQHSVVDVYRFKAPTGGHSFSSRPASSSGYR